MNVIAVFVGGGLGSLLRFAVSEFSKKYFSLALPYGTLICNLLSALIVGWLMALAVNTLKVSDTMKLLIVTGFCGGFSTFSAFSFETFQMMRNDQLLLAAAHVFISVAGCLLFIWAGWKLASTSF